MSVLEIVLLVTGIVAIIVSFVIPGKKSPKDNGQLSGEDFDRILASFRQEIRQMVDREKEQFGVSVSRQSKEAISDYVEEVKQSISRVDQDNNENIRKMKAEADRIIEQMNEHYNDVSTLYAMLNDKHTQVAEDMNRLDQIRSEVLQMQGKLETLREETEAYEEQLKAETSAAGHAFETEADEGSAPAGETIVVDTGSINEQTADDSTRIFDTSAVARAEEPAPAEDGDAQPDPAGEAQPEEPEQPEEEAPSPEAQPEEEAQEPKQPEEEIQELEQPEEETPSPEQNKAPEMLLQAVKESHTIDMEPLDEEVCQKVLQLYEAGFSSMEISQNLQLGIGQVRMVVDLYIGREIDH